MTLTRETNVADSKLMQLSSWASNECRLAANHKNAAVSPDLAG